MNKRIKNRQPPTTYHGRINIIPAPIPRPQHIRIRTKFSDHNERKLFLLLTCFNEYKTGSQVAKETFDREIKYKVHLRLIQRSLSRLATQFTHPYLSRTSRRGKEKIAYRCTEKGRRVACELNYRKLHGLNLNWKHSQLHYKGGKGKKKYNKYNIRCSTNCEKCRFNPTKPAYPEGKARNII